MTKEIKINSSVTLVWGATDADYQADSSIQLFSRMATIWLDSPGRSVNILNSEMIEGLEKAIAAIESQGCSLLLIRSRKPHCFFAGADVSAIAELKCASEANTILERGQSLFARVEALACPTAAVLQGPCLGGGLELALACDLRLAMDTPNTKLGLPEIKLGLIPGWGGTQRLPRLVGLRNALQMILTGSTRNAGEAREMGLLHSVCQPVITEAELLGEIQSLTLESRRKTGTLQNWVLERTKIGRRIIFGMAQRKVGSRLSHYPALASVLEVLQASAKTKWQSYDLEKEHFSRLLFTDTARSLIGLFLARDEARKESTWLRDQNQKSAPIRSVLVVGAGAMGAGIGSLAATKGYQVVFKEIHHNAVEQGRTRVHDILTKMVRRQKLWQAEMNFCLERIDFVTDWDSAAHCDLAIEAVVEVEAVKKEVMEMLDQCLPGGSTLATNTSSLCVTRLAAVTDRPRDVLGLHFFNPVNRMDLVEIVQTESTNQESLARAFQFVKSLGKTPIVTSDKPSFLVNRVLFSYLDESIRMVSEGYDGREIDKQMRSFGMPMGPLELMDQVGLDIAHHVAQSQLDIRPDSHDSLQVLKFMVAHGWLGKKSGLGFYNYESANPELNDRIPCEAVAPRLGLDFKSDGLSKIQRRLVYPILNEAVHCLDEQVVSDAWMVDLGLVLGTGFAPHHGGPLRLIDHIGTENVYHNLCELAAHYGDRFRPADGLVMAVRRKTHFFTDKPNLNWEKEDEPRIAQH